MVVHDFHIVCVIVAPHKADAPLVIDSDTELSGTIIFQSFKTVSGRGAQVLKLCGTIQILKFSGGKPLN